jgi:transcription termination factor NusB
MTNGQPTFDEERITQEEWVWVRGLIEDVARDDARIRFVQALFQWDLAVKQFRKVEQKRIIHGAPTAVDFHFQALCLHALLAIGRALILESKRFDPADLERLQIKNEEIESYVEELEQSLREHHHGFRADELDRVRRKVFGCAS